MLFRLLLFLIVLVPLGLHSKEVFIYKQWHLGAKVITTNIERSKKLAQFKNQQDIYKRVVKKIKSGASRVIIGEGCEGVIDSKFKYIHNGWGYNNLLKHAHLENYQDIMALLPLKVGVKFKKEISAICGDSDLLIKKHALAFSNLRAFSGYLMRLLENKNNPKIFKAYADSLLKNKGGDPLKYARVKSLESLENIKMYTAKRNNKFIQQIIKNIDKNPMVIIGGMHIPDLRNKLDALKLKYTIITPSDYVEKDFELFLSIETILKNSI